MNRFLVLLGRLRAASVNRQLAELAVEVAPDGVTLTLFDLLGELPLYKRGHRYRRRHRGGESTAGGSGTRRRCPGHHARIQRQHPGRTKERHRLAVSAYGSGALKGKPLAVIGASLGSYGGTWAHHETRKSFTIAGPQVVDSIKLSVPLKTLQGEHPREHPELPAKVRAAVVELAAYFQ
jgi:NAD(P)H-dependent FMN reductase